MTDKYTEVDREFIERFTKEGRYTAHSLPIPWMIGAPAKPILSFLHEQLDKAEERGRKESASKIILINDAQKGYIEMGAKAERERILAALENLEQQNKVAKCKYHRKPRGITAEDYDCGDLHIGFDECLSDIRSLLKQDT